MVEQIVNSLCRRLNIKKTKFKHSNGNDTSFLAYKGKEIMRYALGDRTKVLSVKTKRPYFLELDISKSNEGNLLELSISGTDVLRLKQTLEQLAEPAKSKADYRAFIQKIQEYITQRMGLGEDPAKAEVIIPYTNAEEKSIPIILYNLIMNKTKPNQIPGPKPSQHERRKK